MAFSLGPFATEKGFEAASAAGTPLQLAHLRALIEEGVNINACRKCGRPQAPVKLFTGGAEGHAARKIKKDINALYARDGGIWSLQNQHQYFLCKKREYCLKVRPFSSARSANALRNSNTLHRQCTTNAGKVHPFNAHNHGAGSCTCMYLKFHRRQKKLAQAQRLALAAGRAVKMADSASRANGSGVRSINSQPA